MKTYKVSLTLYIKENNEEKAKNKFWELVDDCSNDDLIGNDSLKVEKL